VHACSSSLPSIKDWRKQCLWGKGFIFPRNITHAALQFIQILLLLSGIVRVQLCIPPPLSKPRLDGALGNLAEIGGWWPCLWQGGWRFMILEVRSNVDSVKALLTAPQDSATHFAASAPPLIAFHVCEAYRKQSWPSLSQNPCVERCDIRCAVEGTNSAV